MLRDDRFFVTAFASHQIYEVRLDGTVKRILGNGEPGIVDGAGAKARLSYPNGIACNPWGRRLYVNEFVGDTATSLPRRAIIREIVDRAGVGTLSCRVSNVSSNGANADSRAARGRRV